MGNEEPEGQALQVVAWNATYENSRSRQVDRCRWVALPNRFDGEKISWLIGEGGASAYGIWCAVLALASRGKPRGTLITSTGRPHSPSSLSRITHLPARDFEKVLPLCLACGLLQRVPNPHHPSVDQASPGRHPDVTPCPPGADPNEREGTKEGKDERTDPAALNGQARVRGGVAFSELVHRVVEARRQPEHRDEDLAFLMRLWGAHVWPAEATAAEGQLELQRFAELAENAIKRGRDPIRYIQGVVTKRGWG